MPESPHNDQNSENQNLVGLQLKDQSLDCQDLEDHDKENQNLVLPGCGGSAAGRLESGGLKLGKREPGEPRPAEPAPRVAGY